MSEYVHSQPATLERITILIEYFSQQCLMNNFKYSLQHVVKNDTADSSQSWKNFAASPLWFPYAKKQSVQMIQMICICFIYMTLEHFLKETRSNKIKIVLSLQWLRKEKFKKFSLCQSYKLWQVWNESPKILMAYSGHFPAFKKVCDTLKLFYKYVPQTSLRH